MILCISACCTKLVQSNFDENEVFKRYEPVAVEESWSYVKPSGEVVVSEPSRTVIAPRTSGTKRIGNLSDTQPVIKEALVANYTAGRKKLVNVNKSRGKDVSETLFRLPNRDSKALTRLITSGLNPTLVNETAVAPGPKDPNSKVLASYRILIPLIVPGVKSKKSSGTIDYLTKTKTQMVPVEKTKPKLRRVIQAEQVPEKIITEYVKTDGSPVITLNDVLPDMDMNDQGDLESPEQV